MSDVTHPPSAPSELVSACALVANKDPELMVRHPLYRLCDEAMTSESPSSLLAVTRIALRPGMRLFERGALTEAIYVVHSGIVKETLSTPDGSECTVRLAMRGSVAGLPALLGAPQPHSATVMHAGVACRVPVARVELLRRHDPRIADLLFRDWQRALNDADCLLAALGHGAARARLARLLLLLDSALQAGEPLQLRHGDVAELLAITPVSVARLMGDFRREGLTEERQRQMVLLDRVRLRQLARSSNGRIGRPTSRSAPRSSLSQADAAS